MTIPGEGKDRIFKVSIKWMAIVSWRMLHEALVSGQIPVPLESVQALDVAMRHLASMRYLHKGRGRLLWLGLALVVFGRRWLCCSGCSCRRKNQGDAAAVRAMAQRSCGVLWSLLVSTV